MNTTLPAGWKPIETAPKDGTEILAWRSDCGQFIASYTSADAFPMTQDELDAMDEETLFAKDWFTQWPDATRLDGGETPTLWQPLPVDPCQTCNDNGAVGNILTAEPCPDCTPPAIAHPSRDWELDCDHCNGSGHVFVKHQVAERATDLQEFKEDCECCEGRGFVFAFQDIPGIAEYVKSCRPAPATTQDAPITVSLDADPRGVSVGVWQGSHCIYNGAHAVPSAQDDAKDERQAFEAWSGRTNQGYDLTRNVSGKMATYESNTTEHAYRGFFHGMNAPAAGDALDAARYRHFRTALTSLDSSWLDKVGDALEAMGLDPDDDVLPTSEQVDAAFDAAQQGKGDEA